MNSDNSEGGTLHEQTAALEEFLEMTDSEQVREAGRMVAGLMD